jgi:hypothetical protein
MLWNATGKVRSERGIDAQLAGPNAPRKSEKNLQRPSFSSAREALIHTYTVARERA